MRIIKRIILIICTLCILFSSCGERNGIHVISRESGSGTRSTFVKTFSLTDENGYDITRADADINDSNGIVLANVASDVSAIGYVTVSALSEKVKAVSIDGIVPAAENVVGGKYKASRALLVAIMGDLSEEAGDFISYILSKDGQEVVKNMGYVPISAEKEYIRSNLEGKVTVAGSSSVAPIIERLAEEYAGVSDVKIELQQSDSSSGIRALAQGICDIGLSSRELKEDELSLGILPYEIAYDALAVIVNSKNEVENLSSEQVTKIFSGDVKYWYEVTDDKDS